MGRASAANLFSECPDPMSYCHRGVVQGSSFSAFHLFIDEHMLRCIQKNTNNHGKKDDDDFDLHLDELESFIGPQIARGMLAGNNTPIKQLWSKEWGHPIFKNTMGCNRYQKIMKHLRFDYFLRQRQRRQTDKFCLIFEVLFENCKKCYIPGFDLTIDEQLFPCKTRCPFTKYIWLTSQTNLE